MSFQLPQKYSSAAPVPICACCLAQGMAIAAVYSASDALATLRAHQQQVRIMQRSARKPVGYFGGKRPRCSTLGEKGASIV